MLLHVLKRADDFSVPLQDLFLFKNLFILLNLETERVETRVYLCLNQGLSVAGVHLGGHIFEISRHPPKRARHLVNHVYRLEVTGPGPLSAFSPPLNSKRIQETGEGLSLSGQLRPRPGVA